MTFNRIIGISNFLVLIDQLVAGNYIMALFNITMVFFTVLSELDD